MSNYMEQIKAFFHYTLKYTFNTEFWVKTAIEIFILLIIICFFLKLIIAIARKIAKMLLIIADFIIYDVAFPIGVELSDFFEYKFGSQKWRLRSNNIKKKILDHDIAQEKKENKEEPAIAKGHSGKYIVAFIILISYINFFHYCLPDVRMYYPVFFIPEKIMVEIEYFLTDVVFKTDEEAIPSFYELI